MEALGRRDPNLRLQDIVEAIDRILEYTASLSLESFKADTKTVSAVPIRGVWERNRLE